MIDGEEAEETPNSAGASPPDDQESDGGDGLSQYSSCGGESEFDRYCSANSAMGTPSFRGSSFQDSDFGSLKSFNLGGEFAKIKNSGAERVFNGYRESERGSGSGGGNEFRCDGRDDGVLNFNGKMEGFDLRGNLDVDGYWGDGIVNESKDEGNGEGKGCFRSVENWVNKGERLEIDGGKDRNLSDDSEASSRHEHSDGEESMFGCGSEDERKTDVYYGKNLLLGGGESRRKENQFVMNSAVAFGVDDWDDFVEESKENTIGSIIWGEIKAEKQTGVQVGTSSLSLTDGDSVAYPDIIPKGLQDEVRNTPAACNHVEDSCKLADTETTSLSTNSTNLVILDARSEDAKGAFASSNQASDIDELDEYPGGSPDYNIFQKKNGPLKKEAPTDENLKSGQTVSEMTNHDTTTSEVMTTQQDIVLKNRTLEETNPAPESVVDFHHMVPVKDKEDREAKLSEENGSLVLPSVGHTTTSATSEIKISSAFDQIEDHFTPLKTKDVELNDFYDEIVNDMEDILLDSGESPGSRLAHNTKRYQSQFPRPSRDGGSNASTSGTGTDYAYNWIDQPLKIDRIEVVGARKQKGDVSFSERLVGIQKYTVYKIRVWSGEENWEVERRYRDFSNLYYQLKKLFSDHGWTLPLPWSSVESESRKLFSNASPNVVAERSVLIQECLQSVIHPRFSSISLNALISFLSPSESVTESPNKSLQLFSLKNAQMENFQTLGKTISLVVQIVPLKSTKQMLDSQHYRCAGCHRNFDDGKTRVQELVQALGWGKPRLCEYSGQLFCSSCHNNDTAVLPARVLHFWDFTRYPVSQLAKSFLDSINDQPMLCVSAVNPFLFSKVPTLQHVANMRNRIRAMLPYVRCPFRNSINKGLGSRRYLLDSNDFFALKDLIDLSKGVFSALPAMVETVSRKIHEHITEQCLVCYDVGIPCSARQDCDNPLSLIFPFQDGEVKKCRSCELVFHKNCFKKLDSCPCGARFKQEAVRQSSNVQKHSVAGNLDLVEANAEPNSGLLSGLFSKVMPRRPQIPKKQETKGVDNFILMGSLSENSL